MKLELCVGDKRGGGIALLVKLALEGWRDVSEGWEKVRRLAGLGDWRRGGRRGGFGGLLLLWAITGKNVCATFLFF